MQLRVAQERGWLVAAGALACLFLGVALGLRLKVFALVPFTVSLSLIVAAGAVASGGGLRLFLAAAAAAIAVLQLSFFLGAAAWLLSQEVRGKPTSGSRKSGRLRGQNSPSIW